MSTKPLSEVETERDLDWLHKLLATELELSEDEWLFALSVGISTLPHRETETMDMVAIWHNALVAAMAIWAVKSGPEEPVSDSFPVMEAKWSDLWGKVIGYWELLGRLPQSEVINRNRIESEKAGS